MYVGSLRRQKLVRLVWSVIPRKSLVKGERFVRFEITVKMASAGDPMFFLKTVVTHFECVGCKRCIFEQERG